MFDCGVSGSTMSSLLSSSQALSGVTSSSSPYLGTNSSTPLFTTTGLGLPGEEIPNDPGKMFVGGLSWQTTPEGVKEYFNKFGDVAEVMVMKDPATRRSRGFGFITFTNPASVSKVLAYPQHQLDGKLIEPKVAVPRKSNPKLVMRTKKIFVGGLSATTSLEDIKAYFEQFSKVKESMLAYDKVTNRHRGFGFVTFDNEDVVDKICEIHFHEINGKMVESKKALPKEPRIPGLTGMGGLYTGLNMTNIGSMGNSSTGGSNLQTSPNRSYIANNNNLLYSRGQGSTYYNLQEQYEQYMNLDRADNYNSFINSQQQTSPQDNERFNSMGGSQSRFAGYFQSKTNTGNQTWHQQKNNGNLSDLGNIGEFKENYFRGYNENSNRVSDYINTAALNQHSPGQYDADFPELTSKFDSLNLLASHQPEVGETF